MVKTTAIIIIIVEVILERDGTEPQYPNPSVMSFFLAFGAIMFAYGGLSIFPTIQNDMCDRSKFPKSVFFAYIGKENFNANCNQCSFPNVKKQ